MKLNFGAGDWVWKGWNCMKLKNYKAIKDAIKSN